MSVKETTTSPSITSPHQEGTHLVTAELKLGGMHCSACATRVERALGRLPAVVSASVNLATTQAFVAYDAATISVEQLCRTVADIGYSAEVVDAAEQLARPEDNEHWVIRGLTCWPWAAPHWLSRSSPRRLPVPGGWC